MQRASSKALPGVRAAIVDYLAALKHIQHLLARNRTSQPAINQAGERSGMAARRAPSVQVVTVSEYTSSMAGELVTDPKRLVTTTA